MCRVEVVARLLLEAVVQVIEANLLQEAVLPAEAILVEVAAEAQVGLLAAVQEVVEAKDK